MIADIASRHFKSMVDEHISNLTITQEKLTASNFGETAKTKVEPSNS